MSQKLIFLIPSTSKNCNYVNIFETSLINILLDSLKKFNIENYTFLIGFDNDDEFYLNNKNELEKILPNNFYLHYLTNHSKSYVCVVNQLANLAIEMYDAEYLYLIADDLIIYTLDFIPYFINFLRIE